MIKQFYLTRSFQREAFPRDDAQWYVSARCDSRAENIPICCWLTLGLIGLLCFIILFYFFNCYMHCFSLVYSMVFSVVMHGALVSVSVSRRLRSCRHIIIIIIIKRTVHHRAETLRAEKISALSDPALTTIN